MIPNTVFHCKRYDYDVLTSRFRESRPFRWLVENGATTFVVRSGKSDNQGRRMLFKNIFKFYS